MIAVAKQCQLEYIVITDHMTLAGKDEGFQGYHDSLLVAIGYEINDTHNKNHLLALGTDTVVADTADAQAYINDIKRNGGICFLAHPFEKRSYLKDFPPYEWTKIDSATGYDGLEIWNQMSHWLERLKFKFDFFKLFHPRDILQSIDRDDLLKWDAINRTRFASGVGGVDAHTMKVRMAGFIPYTIFPIKVELKGVRTHVYLPEPLPNRDVARGLSLLYAALGNGNGYICHSRWGDGRNTELFMVDSANKSVLPGKLQNPVTLPAMIHVKIPLSGRIDLIFNGKKIQSSTGIKAEFPIDKKGLYRVEIYRHGKGWIYSNPFVVGEYPLW